MKLASPKVRNRAIIKIFVVAAVGMAGWMTFRTSSKTVYESKSPDGKYRCAIVTESSIFSGSMTSAKLFVANASGWNSTNETEFRGEVEKGSFVANWETDEGGATEGLVLKQLDGKTVVMILTKRFVPARVAATKPDAPTTSSESEKQSK